MSNALGETLLNIAKTFFLGLASMLYGATGIAQQPAFIDLGIFNESRVAVATGTNAQRIGNSVLTYVVVQKTESSFAYTSPVLFGCDSSWIDTLQGRIHEKQAWPPRAVEPMARSENINPVQIPIETSDWNMSGLFFSKKLRSHVNTICRTASAEPRNLKIPVVMHIEKGEEPGSIGSLITGTASRKGEVIDVWMRYSYFRLKPIMGGDGNPLTLNGEVQKTMDSTGAYEMRQAVFDCANRKSGISQFVDYDKDGVVVGQTSSARDNMRFYEVVPSSIGEVTLDLVCKIYGRK